MTERRIMGMGIVTGRNRIGMRVPYDRFVDRPRSRNVDTSRRRCLQGHGVDLDDRRVGRPGMRGPAPGEREPGCPDVDRDGHGDGGAAGERVHGSTTCKQRTSRRRARHRTSVRRFRAFLRPQARTAALARVARIGCYADQLPLGGRDRADRTSAISPLRRRRPVRRRRRRPVRRCRCRAGRCRRSRRPSWRRSCRSDRRGDR